MYIGLITIDTKQLWREDKEKNISAPVFFDCPCMCMQSQVILGWVIAMISHAELLYG